MHIHEQVKHKNENTFLVGVKAVFSVVIATLFIVRHNCNVFPVSWMPVRVVVALFRAFVTILVAVWVLSCVFASGTFKILVGSEQSYTLIITVQFYYVMSS